MLKLRLKHIPLATCLIIFSASAFGGTESSEDTGEKNPKVNPLRQVHYVPAKETHTNGDRRERDTEEKKKTSQEELGLERFNDLLNRNQLTTASIEGFTTEDSKEPTNELALEDHPQKVEKKESDETIEEWMKKILHAIQNRNRVELELLLRRNRKLVNLPIPGDGSTLLMVAMEQEAPDVEIIREFLSLHFDLTDVPDHPGYNYLTYYEEFKPEVLAHAGMEKIIELLMQRLANQEQPSEDHSRKVEKKLSEESIEWMKQVVIAIKQGEHGRLQWLVRRKHDRANEPIPGDESGRTLLMLALEQQPPNAEVIRELLNLHFDLTLVPGHPGYNYLSYYETFKPEILTHEGMEEVIKLLTSHTWKDNEGIYVSLPMLSNPIYVSLHTSTQSVTDSGYFSFSHESTPADDPHAKEKKKPGLRLRLSDVTSSLKSSSSSGAATSRSSRTNDSGSSSGRTPHNTPKANNNSPKPVADNNRSIQENSTTEATTTVQPEVTSGTIDSIVRTIKETLTRSSSKKKRRKSAVVIETKST